MTATERMKLLVDARNALILLLSDETYDKSYQCAEFARRSVVGAIRELAATPEYLASEAA